MPSYTVVQIPVTAYEDDYPHMLAELSKADGEDHVMIDFDGCNVLTPGAVTLLLAKVRGWGKKGKRVEAGGMSDPVFRWLQRMDFFHITGVELKEDFCRHDPEGRFLTLRQIGGKGGADPETTSTQLARCIFPECDVDDPAESGLFDLVQFSISEMALNVTHHSRSTGYVMAQYYKRTDILRMAIADYGVGISGSFQQNGSTHWKAGMTDWEAIELALQPKVSSRSHLATPWGSPVNAGVGLTLLKEFSQMTDGTFVMISGNGYCKMRAGRVMELGPASDGGHFQGTACALSCVRSRVPAFAELLTGAKRKTGLLPTDDSFNTLFS